jgi:outer membrane protein OmpA-like peptidoglycan-associated protein
MLGVQQMKLRALLLGAAAAVVLTGTASAGYERDGWYVGLEGGMVSIPDTELGASDLEFDNGLAAFGTVGYALSDSNWRLEGEIGYRENDLQRIFSPTAAVDMELTEWSYFVNAVYDFKFNSERFGFSLGAGLGMDNPRLEQVGGLKDSDWVPAVQGIVGATYRLSQHWDLALNYRYLHMADPEFKEFSANDMELSKHTVTIGFRYGYDEPAAPPPPPPPPPPPVAPKQFIVFFGWNKCNITAEADAVLSEAAAAAKSSGAASIRVVGHTDTSGSNAYNQKLSECRAGAVKSNLVGKGIADGSISTSGKGEGDLMVQTGDGVKEPQNRRATVDMN